MRAPEQPGRDVVFSSIPFALPGTETRAVDNVSRTLDDMVTTVTTADWSLLHTIEPGLSELYHLGTDPRQEHNVIQERPDKARELHGMLKAWLKTTISGSSRNTARKVKATAIST